jgi:hypothetical protein
MDARGDSGECDGCDGFSPEKKDFSKSFVIYFYFYFYFKKLFFYSKPVTPVTPLKGNSVEKLI